jgi:hypothetical protein
MHAAHKERLSRLRAEPPKPAPIIYSKPAPKPVNHDFGWECMWFYDLLQGFKEPRQVVPIKEIQEAVCRHYGISVLDLISHRRTSDISHPRQVAMYLSRMLSPHSYAQIGRRFGARDHTTVIHASQKIERLLGFDMKLACDVNKLRKVLA